MAEKTYVEDIDRSMYDFRFEEKDAWRIDAGLSPEIVEAGVSPGIAIMSRPTEQTQVMASSFSMVSAPAFAAVIMP